MQTICQTLTVPRAGIEIDKYDKFAILIKSIKYIITNSLLNNKSIFIFKLI
jgi:hypothetical protein